MENTLEKHDQLEEFRQLVKEIKTNDYLDVLQKARESWRKFEGVVDGRTLIRLRR